MKILLIEDSADLANVLLQRLESWGHEVLWLSTRVGLVEDVITAHDFVISDYDVPGGRFEDTKKICDAYGIPLILMSGTERPGAHDIFLEKSYLSDSLKPTIEKIMEGKGGAA